jgi:O-antigen ligase
MAIKSTTLMTTLRATALDLETFERSADWLAVAVAVSLPWSTTATAILITLWLLAVLPTLDAGAVWRQLTTFAGGLPVLLWLIAALGMLWADVGWFARFSGLGGYHRLLVIPLLLTQFRRSDQGVYVLYGFLVSVLCLLAASWFFALFPAWARHDKMPGVPVKDYVIQSGIFLICAFGLIVPAYERLRAGKFWLALVMLCLAAAFLANIADVVTSRTTLFVAPLLVVALGYRQFGVRGVIAAVLIAAALAALAWVASPTLRARVHNSIEELHAYAQTNQANSTGLHLEFLRESLEIVEGAPLIGHGTGSIAEQFREETTGHDGNTAAAVMTVNPHNQIFAVAIELGFLGALVLLAMWAAHFMLFRGCGLTAWIGMIVVIQNVASCLFNSHLFDFSQGWLYVFGVGVTGGMVLRERDSAPTHAISKP